MMKYNLDDLTDEEITLLFQESVREAIQEAKRKSLPVCGFDQERKLSYILYPDGTREYQDDPKNR